MEMRRQSKILLQLQFERLGTQIQWANETFPDGVNMSRQDGRFAADHVSLGSVRDGDLKPR